MVPTWVLSAPDGPHAGPMHFAKICYPCPYPSGNPLEETHSADGDWREKVAEKLAGLKKLDGEKISRNLIRL